MKKVKKKKYTEQQLRYLFNLAYIGNNPPNVCIKKRYD